MQAIELRHLRCLVAVAEERSFSRAAKRLGTSQPAISQLLKRLEDLLGHRLVARDRFAVSLTAAGEEVLPQMRQALSAVDRALEATRRSLQGETGRLRVGLSAPSLYGGVPALIRRFRAERPAVAIDMAVVATMEQGVALLEGRLDVAFGAFALDHPGLAQHPVGEEALCLALPRWHRLAGQAVIRFAQLQDEAWIMPPAGSPMQAAILRDCQEAGFTPVVAVESGDFSTTVGLVLAGSGVALMAESFRDFGGPDLALVPVKAPEPRMRHFLTHRANEISPAVLGFLRMMRPGAAG